MHETYLTGVEMAMMDGGAGAVMTNYNSVNGITACANTYILKNILRGMWGYQSIVLTDWGGNYEFTTDNGVTMETPSGGKNNAESINNALDSGLLTLEDIDEALSYNLYACAKAGYFGMVQISATAQPQLTPHLRHISSSQARQAKSAKRFSLRTMKRQSSLLRRVQLSL